MKKKKDRLTRPARLEKGDRIGVVAPASHFNRELYLKGLAVLETMGFDPFAPEDIFQKTGRLAGSDEHRAKTVNRLFADKSVKAIICARGGFGSMRILPMLDFRTIRENPKIFVGFSDISALLAALTSKCNLVAYHGPVVTSLGQASRQTTDALAAAVSSGSPLKISPGKATVIRSGRVSGRVSGGNLTTLCHLMGTPFAPDTCGDILFLEDKGEALYRLDRMFTQMKLAGCFDGLAGLMLGSFEECGRLEDIYTLVDDLLKQSAFPILAGFEIGHGRHNLTVPIGLEATLDTDAEELSFHDAATVSLNPGDNLQ